MWSMILALDATTGSTGSARSTATASITSTACGSATATMTRPVASRPSGRTRRWRAKLIGSLSISSTGMSSARGRSRRYGISDWTDERARELVFVDQLQASSTSPSRPPSSRCFASARSIDSGATPAVRDQDLAEERRDRRPMATAASRAPSLIAPSAACASACVFGSGASRLRVPSAAWPSARPATRSRRDVLDPPPGTICRCPSARRSRCPPRPTGPRG